MSLSFDEIINERGVASVDASKASKESVGYSDSTSATDKCGLCEFYIEGGRCRLVEGDIDPQGWCELFDPEVKWTERPCTRSEMARTGDPLVDFILRMPLTRRNIDHPVIDRSMPVPYGAGGSIPLEDPTTFIDNSVPDRITMASGASFDPADPWTIHENAEQRVMELLISVGVDDELAYRFAHFCVAEIAEHAWYRYNGIDPDEAEAAELPILDKLRSEQIGEINSNPRLYLKPYPHDREELARQDMREDLAPTPEEEKYCRETLTAVLGLSDGAMELPVYQQDLDKKIEQYLLANAPEIAAVLRKQQPSAGDVHAPGSLGSEEDRKKWAAHQGHHQHANVAGSSAGRGEQASGGRGHQSAGGGRHIYPSHKTLKPQGHAFDKARSFEEMLDPKLSTAYFQDDVGKVWGSNADLPKGVQSLPDHAKSVFRRVANERMKAGDGEVGAIRQAWTAVKNGWKKEGGKWVRKDGNGDQSNSSDNARPFTVEIPIIKTDDEFQYCYGWASISTVDGQHIIDKQGDIIPVEELEKAAYEFVQFSRDMGEMHMKIGVGRMIESCVFTKEKARTCNILAMDDQANQLEGWFVGFHVVDPHAWQAIKSGERPELSIGGRATWEEA
jgi:hypothetical protein